MPIARATPRAASNSPVANAGDTAVTASARPRSARHAAAATSDESTPPENATTTLRSTARIASRSSNDAISHRGCHRLGPDRLDRPGSEPCERGAVVVLGRDVHDAPADRRDLDAHLPAVEFHPPLLAIQLGPVEPRDPAAQCG